MPSHKCLDVQLWLSTYLLIQYLIYSLDMSPCMRVFKKLGFFILSLIFLTFSHYCQDIESVIQKIPFILIKLPFVHVLSALSAECLLFVQAYVDPS